MNTTKKIGRPPLAHDVRLKKSLDILKGMMAGQSRKQIAADNKLNLHTVNQRIIRLKQDNQANDIIHLIGILIEKEIL